jgi:hypothetical protein
MNSPDPTADYRKYPKGPNFLLIVILFSAAIIVILVLAVFVVGNRGKTLIPRRPNPTPNSMVQPLQPSSSRVQLGYLDIRTG